MHSPSAQGQRRLPIGAQDAILLHIIFKHLGDKVSGKRPAGRTGAGLYTAVLCDMIVGHVVEL
jgi:hypothetical protein